MHPSPRFIGLLATWTLLDLVPVVQRRCQENFRRLGGLLLEAEPQELPAALVNRYLEIKRGGRL